MMVLFPGAVLAEQRDDLARCLWRRKHALFATTFEKSFVTLRISRNGVSIASQLHHGVNSKKDPKARTAFLTAVIGHFGSLHASSGYQSVKSALRSTFPSTTSFIALATASLVALVIELV